MCILEACSVVLVYTNVWLESSAGELEKREPSQDKAVSDLLLEGDTSGTATLYIYVLSCPFTILYSLFASWHLHHAQQRGSRKVWHYVSYMDWLSGEWALILVSVLGCPRFPFRKQSLPWRPRRDHSFCMVTFKHIIVGFQFFEMKQCMSTLSV